MLLEIRNLFAGYEKDIHILRELSLSARTGQITIIIGANGVGKTTVLKAVCGFLRPVSGKIFYKGGEITGISPYTLSARGIAYIPQRRNVFPYLSVEENWEMGAWTFRRDKKLIRQRIGENYERFPSLRAKRKLLAGSLSGGEQRMVEIGRALMTDPDLLLVDEPTAGLAPILSGKIYDKLRQLNAEEDKTILLVDQNIRQAMKIADYIYVLELGRNRAEGTRAAFETDLREMIRSWLF